MADRTIPEIQEEAGRIGSEILTDWHNTLDAIKGDREPEAGLYLDRLNDEQRMALLREQKERSMDEARARTIEEYRANRERYRDEALARTARLKRELFGEHHAERIERMALASEEELARLMDRASFTESQELAQAVFMEAHSREAGDLVARYFDEVDPEARDLYNEWREAPGAEVLERQIESVETIVHRPSVDSLMPGPRVGV